MKLTAADKRYLAKATEFPWREDGGPSVYEFLENPSYDPAKYGITRRIINDDVAELVQFSLLSVRTCWNDYARTRRGQIPGPMWHHCLWALAVNDLDGFEHYVSYLPATCPPDLDGGIPWHPMIYDLFFGIARNDAKQASEALDRIDSAAKIATLEANMVSAMRSIHDDSPTDFAESLSQVSKSLRRIRAMDPHYKLIDVAAHGIYELACRTNSNVASEWDVSRPLPWDTGLYEWCRTGQNAIDLIDRSKVSAEKLDAMELCPPKK